MYGPARCPLLLLLLALLVASCAPGRTANPAAAAIPPVVAAAPISVATGDDVLTPLTSGPAAFAAIGGELRQAQRSIELEMYEFQRPDLAAIILDARARGVIVTAIMDPSETSSRAIWAELRQGGVQVVAFPIERRTIDHVKLLIIDGDRAVVGGINWGTRSPDNQDFDVLARGPVVGNLRRVFDADLALAGQPAVIPAPTGDRTVQVLVTRPGDAIRTAALAAIAAARRTIDIEMFVLSDRIVIDALTAAARGGRAVRVLLDPSQPQNADTMNLLRAAGAGVRFYAPANDELLHAKAGIFDGTTVLFGSCNWSRSGFTRNHELDLLVTDPGLASAFLPRIERDWAVSG